MKLERGILVDAKGNFLGAFQWDADKPRPTFNAPRAGKRRIAPEDKKTLLPESAAAPGMENMRWDFKKEVWTEPTNKAWLVDQRGNIRGSRRYFPDQIPNIPVGWQLTEKAPPKTHNRKPYFDLGADEWKFPLTVARVENDVVVNVEAVRHDFVAPGDVEYVLVTEAGPHMGWKRNAAGTFEPDA